MFKRLVILFLFLQVIRPVYSQLDMRYYFGAEYMKEDSVPMIIFNPICIYADRIFKNKKDAQNYYWLVRNVKRVYPLARVCRIKIDEYNAKMALMTSSSDKKKLLKQAEKQLKEQFTPEIKDLTYTQGKILLKLIYRQTNNTSYDLIKDYRGTFQAVFWQFFAKVFGNDLKMKYDPYGEDKTIEDIVQLIEHGVI